MLFAHAGGQHSATYLAGPLLALALAAGMYARGLSRLPAPARRTWRGRAVSFYAGLMVLGVALVSPLEAVAERALSAHMVQHMLLLLVSPPMLVFGRPITMAAIALPSGWPAALRRARTSRSGSPRPPIGPLPAWLVVVAVLWTWHLPALYEAAVEYPVVHALEHAGFLAAGLVVWAVALGSLRQRQRSYGAALAMLVSTSLASAALGALLTFAPTTLYGLYDGGRYLGFSPLEHQQLAGVLMWVPGFLVYALTAAWIALAWFRDLDRRNAPAYSDLAAERGRP